MSNPSHDLSSTSLPDHDTVRCIFTILPIGALSHSSKAIHTSIFFPIPKNEQISTKLLETQLLLKLPDLVKHGLLNSKTNDLEVFIRHSQIPIAYNSLYKSATRYMSPFCDKFLRQSFSSVAVQAEIWHKNDWESPSHIYLRKDTAYPLRLRVKCTQVSSRKSEGAEVPAGHIGSQIHFSVPLGTKQCITAFRRDLMGLIASRCDHLPGFFRDKFDVEVYFKRSPNATKESVKTSFEDDVAQSMSKEKPLEIQFALRSKSKTVKPSSTSTTKAIPVQVKPSRGESGKKAVSLHQGFLDAMCRDIEKAREDAQASAAAENPAKRAELSASTVSKVGSIATHVKRDSSLNCESKGAQQPCKKQSTASSSCRCETEEVNTVKNTTQHNATCNLCNKGIFGIRWKCTACIDFDVCSACKVNTSSTHPFHRWIKIKTSDALSSGVRPSDWQLHRNIICDGCDEAIVGPRFKCIKCPDFDWCHSCESDPTMHHGKPEEETHLFLKINKPLPHTRMVEGAKLQAQGLVHCINVRNNVLNRLGAEDASDVTLNMPGGFRETLPEKQESKLDKIWEIVQRMEKGQNETLKRIESVEAHLKDANEVTRKTCGGFEPDCTELPSTQAITTNFPVTAQEACPENDENIASLHARLADLSVQAQKLPGASLVTKGQFKVEQDHTSVIEEDAQSAVEDYDMQVEADITVPDGAHFVAGSLFDKIWRVRNAGGKAWPEETCITSITKSVNPFLPLKQSSTIGRKIMPGEVAEICMPDLVAPTETGKDVHYFRLALPSEFGKEPRFFGDQLWYDIEIVNEASSNETTRASNSIASSFHHPSTSPPSYDAKKGEDEGEMNGSSFFQAPFAPQSVRTPSTNGRQTESALHTPTNEQSSSIDADELISLGSDEEFQIIEPSSDEESD